MGDGARPRSPRRLAALIAVVMAGTAATTGCGGTDGHHTGGRWTDRSASPASPTPGQGAGGGSDAGPGARSGATESPGSGRAPATPFAVGVRGLSLHRGSDRPLATSVWYPADGTPGGSPRTGAEVAAGRFPLLLFSHGLTSKPEYYAGLLAAIASAGFVVAAPAYPYTNADTKQFKLTDVPNQPADAFSVIDAVLRLDTTGDDPLAGHLDTARVGAAGHSAGGFTTAGMLAAKRDARLRAAVIVAGGSMGVVTPPSTEVLFVHGDADETVAYSGGRSAYDKITWPKAFLTVVGGDHGRYLTPGRPGYPPVLDTITDFLRANLYGDAAARARLGAGRSADSVRYEAKR